MSENAFTGALLNPPVMFDFCVCPGLVLWQVAQPIELKSAAPLEIELAETVFPLRTTEPVGGGARVRMKLANAETSSRTAAPEEAGLLESSG